MGELEFLRSTCDGLDSPLSPLPKEITPEYFYYMLNSDVTEEKIQSFISSNTMQFEPTRSNETKREFKSVPCFKAPFIPKYEYLTSQEKPDVDLSPEAIQSFLFDERDDENDWFLQERDEFDYSNDYILEDQSKVLKEYTEKLKLPHTVQSITKMMETESWTHPTHNNITARIKLWQNSVYHFLKNNYTKKKNMKSYVPSESTEEITPFVNTPEFTKRSDGEKYGDNFEEDDNQN